MTEEGDRITFEGPCPFLTCFETSGHSHPVCPECCAVRYGNIFCPTCRIYNEKGRTK